MFKVMENYICLKNNDLGQLGWKKQHRLLDHYVVISLLYKWFTLQLTWLNST